MTPLISIIVPVYNSAKSLSQCLDSLCSQSYSNLEILVIDDGSIDSSSSIYSRYACQDPRVKVHKIDNSGVSFVRNLGIELSTGQFIGFCDSDDWIEPDMFETLLKSILDAEADVAICSYYKHRKDGVYAHNIIYDRLYTGQKALFESVIDKDLNNFVWSILVKSEIAKETAFPVGRSLFEDTIFFYKMFERAHTVVHINSALYHYIRSDESALGEWDLLNQLAYIEAQQIRYQDLGDRHPELRPAMLRKYRRTLLSAKRRFSASDHCTRQIGAKYLKQHLLSFYIQHRKDMFILMGTPVLNRVFFNAFMRFPSLFTSLRDFLKHD